MERIRTLTSTLVATLLYFTSIGVEAKVLSCEATKGNGRGWIPTAFQIDVSNDRKTANVISPVTDVFGAKPFEKSFLGSTLWSRGKGKSKMGDYYNYQLRLDLDSNDTEAKIVMTMQGYRDNELQFRCSVDSGNRVASGQAVVPRSQDYTSSVGLFQLGKMSRDALCKYASGEWRGAQFTAQDAIRYARDSGVDCKPSLDQGSVAKTPTYRRQQSSETLHMLSAKDLCEKAISSETMQWSERPEKSEYISEAKRRGYSCGVLSERPTWDICMSAYLLQSRGDKLQEAEMIWNEIVRRGVMSSCEVNYGHDYSALKKHLSELEAEKVARKPESHLSFDDKSVLRIINYVLNGNEGVGIIGYNPTELRERRQSRVSPILIAGELCRVSTSDYRKDWTLDCPSGLVGAGIFSGADANGAVTGSGQVGGEQFSFTHSRCSALIDCDTIKKTLLSNLRTTPVKQGQSEVIATDNQNPSIRITASNSDGARGTISGMATDNMGIAEVLIDGQAVAVDSSGRFTTSTFIPSGGIDIQITAYDLKGLSTTETIRLERTQRTQTISRLAAVNPLVGPKQKPSRDRAALIIGLEQYAEAPPADYASRDAQMFADYAREKLGIAPGNIKVLTDTEATRSGLLRALKVWLPQAVQPDKTDLYVFYAGHGMASDDGESAYIVPYGADTFLLEDTAISRERFYEEIGAAKPRTATFFFDNCYAGTTRSEERLLAQRPLSIKVQESPVPDNYLVFTAGESNQTAGVLDEVKHGRFSYFVFKGLEGEADANQDGKISAGELHKYVRESVGRFSAGAQTPTMLGDSGRWVLR